MSAIDPALIAGWRVVWLGDPSCTSGLECKPRGEQSWDVYAPCFAHEHCVVDLAAGQAEHCVVLGGALLDRERPIFRRSLAVQVSSSNLEDAALDGVLLGDADLSSANLTRANLRGARMERCNLDSANLSSEPAWD